MTTFNFDKINEIKIESILSNGTIGNEFSFYLKVLFPTGFGTPEPQLEQYGVGISTISPADLSDIGPNEIELKGWQVTNWSDTTGYETGGSSTTSSIGTTSEDSFSGSRSALINLDVVDTGEIIQFRTLQITNAIEITTGQTATFRFWAKLKSGTLDTVDIVINEIAFGPSFLRRTTKTIQLTNKWVPYQFKIVIGDNTDAASAGLDLRNTVGNIEFYFDKAQFVIGT